MAASSRRTTRLATLVVAMASLPTSSSRAQMETHADPRTIPFRIVERHGHGLDGISVDVTFRSETAPRDAAGITRGMLFDTGSSGLRVFAQALPTGVARRTGVHDRHTYGGGMQVETEEAVVDVAVGSVRTPHPITIELIDRARCAPDRPHCAVGDGTIDAWTRVGLWGVMGVGLRGSASNPRVFSPLEQLEPQLRNGYTIVVDDATRAGVITLSPTSAETRGYRRVSLRPPARHDNGVPTWNDDGIQVCFALAQHGPARECGNGMIDSGTADLVFLSDSVDSAVVDGRFVRAGESMRVWVDGGFDWTVTSFAHAIQVRGAQGGFNHIVGMMLFEQYDLLFDVEHGQIGFRQRAPHR